MNNWLANQIGSGAANLISALVVSIIIIAAIYATFKVKRMQSGSFIVGKKAKTPRLSVCDAAAIDRTRRLVLIRRDNVEHLILIGGPSDIVVETNISAENTKAIGANSSEKPLIDQLNTMKRQSDGIIRKPVDARIEPIAREAQPVHGAYPLRQVSEGISRGRASSANSDGDLSNVAPDVQFIKREEPLTNNGERHAPQHVREEPSIMAITPDQSISDELEDILFEEAFDIDLNQTPKSRR